MRTPFFTLSAIMLLVASASGQSPSAAAKSEVPIQRSGGLTKEERVRAVGYLTETHKEFLAAVDGVSDAQWTWKATPEKWSIAETAEHIATAEQMIWDLVSGKMMKAAATPEKAADAKGKEETIMKMIPDRSRKAQAPEQLKPTGKWTTREALVQAFKATREKEIAYLQETQEDLRSHFEEHPFLKTMDAWQWLLFNGAHGKRHTAQILEVKAERNFPKS